MDLGVIFLTGITVGGLTCLAVQGGLLASVIAAREKDDDTAPGDTVFPTLAFLIARLIAFTLLGSILGLFGETAGINQTVQIIMQFVAGIYMLAVALNLLNVHPIFRYTVIQPPKFLTSRVKSASKRKDLFAPALLGLMTIFIPCGTTLAMEALAISSGHPLVGATIMATFILGTTPLFFGLGWITNILGDSFRGIFLKVASIAVIYLGLASINGALIASDSPLALRLGTPSAKTQLYDQLPASQNIQIDVTAHGYSPSYIRVQKGLPVNLTLVGKGAYSCASAFRIPALGVSKNIQPNETYKLSFTPNKAGPLTFTCSMGMYSGTIDVI